MEAQPDPNVTGGVGSPGEGHPAPAPLPMTSAGPTTSVEWPGGTAVSRVSPDEDVEAERPLQRNADCVYRRETARKRR